MWGNRHGWAIAAVLAALIGTGVWQLIEVNRLTPPTALAAVAQRPLSVEIDFGSVMPAPAGAVKDAGAIYLQAIAAVAREPARYDALESTDDPLEIEHSPAGELVMDAAALRGGAILSADPAANVGYRPSTDALDSLLLLGRCFSRSALLRASKDPDAAKQALQAEFAMGHALFAERIRYVEADAGLNLMRDAAAGLGLVAQKQNDAAMVARLNTLDRSAAGLAERQLRPVWEAVAAIDPGAVAEHAGDVYTLAGRETAERMWRVEAILALGRHRFSVERLADQLIVPRRLRELAAGEKDPVILAAIDAAQKLTVEEFRTLR